VDQLLRRPAPLVPSPEASGHLGSSSLSRAEVTTLESECALTTQQPRSLSKPALLQYFFSLLPSPSAPTSSTTSTYGLILTHSRSEYSELRSRLLRSPDGGWVNDGSSSGGSPRPDEPKGGVEPVGVQVNNPLGLDSANPWSAWFEDLELRRTIRQDVQRTCVFSAHLSSRQTLSPHDLPLNESSLPPHSFPEVDYFREPATQDKMVDLLFIWSKLTPEIGYRQGMHELLAPLLWTVDFDSLPSSPDSADSLAHLVLSRDHVEHDTWQLFSALMKSAKTFYDFTPSVPLAVDKSSPSASTTSLTLSHSKGLHSQALNSSSSVLVQPIVGTAIRIHDSLLKTIDHELWAKMEELGVEPQLYGIRWLRLLFSREFPIDDALALWDGLFAEDSSLRLMEHICIAMLLRIRDALLQADYSEFLQLLLRYPILPDGTHRISLILQQAIYLRDNVSADAGERCRAQNVQVGAIAGGDIVRGQDTARRRPSSQMGRAGHHKSSSMSPATQVGGFLAEGGFVGDLAKGVYGRAEALGINKALFGTFNEIKVS
jgi:TBC1 domain family member 5